MTVPIDAPLMSMKGAAGFPGLSHRTSSGWRSASAACYEFHMRVRSPINDVRARAGQQRAGHATRRNA